MSISVARYLVTMYRLIMPTTKHHTPDRARDGKTLCGRDERPDHDDWSVRESCQACARVAAARHLERVRVAVSK